MPLFSGTGAEPWWHNGEPSTYPQGYSGHLQWVNPTCALILSSYPLRPVLQAYNIPKPLSSSKFLQVRDHHSLGSTIWPLTDWSILCLWVFSFHLLHKPSNLTSASTTYIGKAAVENINDCILAKSSAIKPVLILLDPSESFTTLASSF